MAEQIYELTYEGITEKQEELERRKTVVAAEVAERLKEARALGDLSENSEYDDAKAAQAENEMRIMEIEQILKNAKLIEDKEISKTRVTLGGFVTLIDEDTKEEREFKLVGQQEEDIFQNKISQESPVGAAIMGKKKNDVVDVRTPAGTLRYRIVKIAKSK
ncbi:MAG TPA: transcription elongation factor GreA [Clostridiaceae bacterium]|jgi:transcription elongation factor GreA|nr:transcription elongation factor GreA [Clostridiaceae bacterium]